jgi:DHA2 family multidrug resistance protein
LLNGSDATMAKSGSGPVLALQRAYNQVMGVIQQQAALLSYVNAFWVVSMILAWLVPLPFLLKKPS